MQYMHSYFQILKFPLIVIAFACFLCGVSNLILHPTYGLVTIIANDGVFLVGGIIRNYRSYDLNVCAIE